MTMAAALFSDLQARGVTLAAAGDRLRFHPRAAVSADELEALRANKAELLRLLADGDFRHGYSGYGYETSQNPGNAGVSLPTVPQDRPGDSYEFAERAAIMEFDGGLPRPEAERLAMVAGAHSPGPQDLPSDIGPTAGPEGDAPTCSACGSVRIGQGRRWRWCIDCETRIGPVIASQDLAEAVPVAIPEASTPARPGWVLPPWPPMVPDSILADLPTPCSGCGRAVGTGQPGRAAGLCFGCWQGQFTNLNHERRHDGTRTI